MNNGLLYALTVLIWGSTWLAIEFQLGIVPPEVSVFYRYVGAAALLFAWCLARRLRLSFDRAAHLRFALLGLLLFCLNYIFAYHAQRYITSALTAIAFSTMLWMNIVNARIFFGVRAGRRVVFGAALGVAGIATMFSPAVTSLSLADVSLYGALLSLGGAYVASLGNMVSQASQHLRLPIVQSNAWGMLYGAIFTGTIVAWQGSEFVIDWSAGYLISLSYLIVFGSIIAFGAYLTLLGRIGAHRAGYATVLFPVVALVLSVLFEGMQITLPIIAGAALVLIGNVFVMTRIGTRNRMPEPAGRDSTPGGAMSAAPAVVDDGMNREAQTRLPS